MARPINRNKSGLRNGGSVVSLKGILNVAIFSTFFLVIFSLLQIPGPGFDEQQHATTRNAPFRQAADEPTDASSSPIQFVLFLGIEGTGHHFWQDLVKESPIFDRVKKYGLHPEFTKRLTRNLYRHKKNRWEGLWSSPCQWHDSDPTANVTLIQDEVVATLRAMKEHVAQQQRQQYSIVEDEPPVLFPVNFLASGDEFGVMSYPTFLKPCRALQYPNLDIFYTACNMARVRCEHVYIYRDPYAVIKSTVDNRAINNDKLEAIHLYTTQLHIIYSQLSFFPNQLSGCWNYDDALSPNEWAKEINPILQFPDIAALGDAIRRVYRPKPTLTEKDKQTIVHSEFNVYMESFSKVHAAVVQQCKTLRSQSSTSP
jgi:hypothetical protein